MNVGNTIPGVFAFSRLEFVLSSDVWADFPMPSLWAHLTPTGHIKHPFSLCHCFLCFLWRRARESTALLSTNLQGFESFSFGKREVAELTLELPCSLPKLHWHSDQSRRIGDVLSRCPLTCGNKLWYR